MGTTKDDAFVKSLQSRYPGESRIGPCPGLRSGIRDRRRGPEVRVFPGFRLEFIPNLMRDRNDQKSHPLAFYEAVKNETI
jgi:hypothetical protein